MTKQAVVRLLSLLVVIGAMVMVKSDSAIAQTPGQGAYGATKTTVGAAAAMTGFAAGACSVLTAGGCGAGLIVGGLVLGGLGATLSAMPTPPPDWQIGHNASPSQMPDYPDAGYGGDDECISGGIDGVDFAPEMFMCD